MFISLFFIALSFIHSFLPEMYKIRRLIITHVFNSLDKSDKKQNHIFPNCATIFERLFQTETNEANFSTGIQCL